MNEGGLDQSIIALIIAIAILLLAIAILFLFPHREVTQPPGKRHWVWEALFPGTSPIWHVFGGFVLIAWTYLVIQDLALNFIGTPYLITGIAIPSPLGYGVPGADTGRALFALINPSWIWVYLAPAVVFAVNLILVLRARRRA